MKSLQLAALSALLIVASNGARADTIVSWPSQPNGATLPAMFTNAALGATADPLGRGPGLGQGGAVTFDSNGFTVPSPGNFADAFAAGDFLTFAFATTTPVNLTDMDIRYDRTGVGPNNLQIELSINSGPYVPIFTDASISSTSEEHLGVDLSAFAVVTDADFRIVLFGATSAAGSFDIESIGGGLGGPGIPGIVLRGEAAVPEPTSVVLTLGSLVGLHTLRRRR